MQGNTGEDGSLCIPELNLSVGDRSSPSNILITDINGATNQPHYIEKCTFE